MPDQAVREAFSVPTLSDFTSHSGTPIIVNSSTGVIYFVNSSGLVKSVLAGLGLGTVTNDNASAGYVGEYFAPALASGSATSLTTATSKTIISQSLTAGDWDVWGVVDYIPNAATSITQFQEGISTTNNTLGADDTYTSQSMTAVILGAVTQRIAVPMQRLSLASTTTAYLVANATFTINTMTAFGTLFCRRIR